MFFVVYRVGNVGCDVTISSVWVRLFFSRYMPIADSRIRKDEQYKLAGQSKAVHPSFQLYLKKTVRMLPFSCKV